MVVVVAVGQWGSRDRGRVRDGGERGSSRIRTSIVPLVRSEYFFDPGSTCVSMKLASNDYLQYRLQLIPARKAGLNHDSVLACGFQHE